MKNNNEEIDWRITKINLEEASMKLKLEEIAGADKIDAEFVTGTVWKWSFFKILDYGKLLTRKVKTICQARNIAVCYPKSWKNNLKNSKLPSSVRTFSLNFKKIFKKWNSLEMLKLFSCPYFITQ